MVAARRLFSLGFITPKGTVRQWLLLAYARWVPIFQKSQHLHEFPLAPPSHPGLQQTAQRSELFGELPSLQRSGLVQGRRLLLQQGQVADGIEDEVVPFVGAGMSGNDLSAAVDHHLSHVAFYQHVPVSKGHRLSLWKVLWMYHVEIYVRVRRACMVEGMSVREASRVFGLHRDTVRKMLAYSAPPGYRRQDPPRWPRLVIAPGPGPFLTPWLTLTYKAGEAVPAVASPPKRGSLVAHLA